MEIKFKGLIMGKVKLLTCLLLGFLLLDIESFAQRNYKVKSAKISFQIKNAGINVEGSFSGLNAIIVFDDKNPQTSSIEASIDANTIQTGITMRDNHLRKEEYFRVTKYPRILISTTKIEKSGTGYKGYFKLNIKGVTKDVTIPLLF